MTCVLAGPILREMNPGEKDVVETQLVKWARQKVAFPDARLGKCTKLVLRHLSVDKKNQGDVEVWMNPDTEGGEVEPLLHEVAAAAQEDANTLNSGVQTYALCAYYELDKTTVFRKIFRVSSTDTEVERDMSPSEPADARGLVAQTMRHMEAIMRTATITQGYQLQSLRSQLEESTAMNKRFMESHVDMMVLVQETLDGAHRRRLEERDAEAKLAMQDAAFSKLDTLLPIVFNRIAGKQVFPEEDASFMMVCQLLEGLTETQQQQILATLSDSQRLLLVEAMATYEKKKSKWLADKAKGSLLGTQAGAANSLPDLGRKPPATADTPRNALLAPVPVASPLRDRVREPETPSSDPVIRKLEQDGARFVSRFRDLLTPTGPSNPDDPKGEPR